MFFPHEKIFRDAEKSFLPCECTAGVPQGQSPLARYQFSPCENLSRYSLVLGQSRIIRKSFRAASVLDFFMHSYFLSVRLVFPLNGVRSAHKIF
jgi:hypothetical protein